jgi:formylmethanofuran dehydrogenase subunit E
MRSFDELLEESSSLHGHLCAGQVLGVRMATVGCREIDIEEPRGNKTLMVYVEIDRCATDAIQAVTGCSLGKRTLKFLDYGKMAATFVNLEKQEAVRVLAKDEARMLVPLYAGDIDHPRDAQKKAYAVMPEAVLFSIRHVSVQTPEEDMPGIRSGRVLCAGCGEGINFKREVKRNGRTLCIPCARRSYLPDVDHADLNEAYTKVVLIAGYKKVGKTALIEKLIPELSARGYRVGTVKHHHSEFPIEMDAPGTDSWKHRKAGAVAVALVTPTAVALFRDVEETLSLDEIVGKLSGVDIILVEGFHEETRAKIEVLSRRSDKRLCKSDEQLVAVVGRGDYDGTVPRFEPGNIKPLADLIETEILLKPVHAGVTDIPKSRAP